MDQVALTYYLVKNCMTMKEIGAGWGGGDTHPLHSFLIPPEKLHKLHVSGSRSWICHCQRRSQDIPHGEGGA